MVDAWIHARQLLPNVMDQELLDSSQQELRNLFKAYKDISSIEATGASGREDMHWLKRAFILYPTTSKKARRIKIAFWLILITSAMAITGAAIPKPGADPSLEYLLTHPSIFVALIPFLLAIVVLQNMAENQRRSDRSKS
ncbi:hypothetical protein [Rhodanobacter sp. C06]|uniref:hypothetical protein n=1 Tax=Rhodanobacter sp. C06 TaxID=1945854 RepID=UPI00111573CB|nr:hypothetical protein [Rhodanobacter sp. C06]